MTAQDFLHVHNLPVMSSQNESKTACARGTTSLYNLALYFIFETLPATVQCCKHHNYNCYKSKIPQILICTNLLLQKHMKLQKPKKNTSTLQVEKGVNITEVGYKLFYNKVQYNTTKSY